MTPTNPFDGCNGRFNELEHVLGLADDTVKAAEILSTSGNPVASLFLANAACEVLTESLDHKTSELAKTSELPGVFERMEETVAVGSVSDWECDL